MAESEKLRIQKRNKHKGASDYVKGLIILLLCAGWLWFAVCYWNAQAPLYRMTSCAYLKWLQNHLDALHFFVPAVYLHLAPFVLLTHLFTVSLPESSFRGRTPVLYRILAGVLLVCALAMMAGSCTDLPGLLKNVISSEIIERFVLFSDQCWLWLSPVCLGGELIVLIVKTFRGKAKPESGLLNSVLMGLFCIAAGALCAGGSCLLLAVLKDYAPQAVSMVENFCHTLASSPSMFFSSLILAPIIEETAFRGLIQHHMSRYFPSWLSILLASVMFGLWHRNPGQFVYTFFFGLVLGAAYQVSGKLVYPLIMHFAMNLSAILVFSDSSACIFGSLDAVNGVYRYLMSLSLPIALALLVLIILILTFSLRFFAHRFSRS